MNIYGPYLDRERFWSNIFSLDCLKNSRMIIGGDLNFSLGFSKIWGARARLDNLSTFFSGKMDGFGIVDVAPSVIVPTWSNRRVGIDNISKILDRLLVSADLLDLDLHIRQWVGCGGDSDHQPIFLQILSDNIKLRCPFKFNAHWLPKEEFVALLK